MCASCSCQAIPAHLHDWDELDRLPRRVAHHTEGSSAC